MLKPYFKSVQQQKEEAEIIHLRIIRFMAESFEKFPDCVVCNYHFDNFGMRMIRLFVNLPTDCNEIQKHSVLDWAEAVTGEEVKRRFRKDEGAFYYRATKKYVEEGSYWEVIVFIEHAPEPGCELRKEEVTRTEYKAYCKGTGEALEEV